MLSLDSRPTIQKAFSPPRLQIRLACVAGILFSMFASIHCAVADDGQPVALRQWPNGRFTIETMWNLHINFGGEAAGRDSNSPSPDFDTSSVALFGGGSSGTVRRLINTADAEFITSADPMDTLANDVSIARLKIDNEPTPAMSVKVDGVHFVFLNGLDADQTRSFLTEHADTQGKSVVIVATDKTFDAELCGAISKKLSPNTLVVGSHVTSVNQQPVTAIAHNTLLVAATPADAHDPQPRVVTLTDSAL